MSIPAAITRLFSFTAFQQAQGDDSFPGTEIDCELDQTNNALDALIAAFKAVVRADGKFANGVVTRNALAADVVLGFGYSRPWDAAAAYRPGESVTRGYGLYQALTASTGQDPKTTPAAWVLVADLSQAVVLAANAVTAAAIADGSVTNAKLAGGITGDKLADGSIPASKIGAGLGVVPVGARMGFGGIRAPAGWLFENGAAVSRTTYADLFEVLTQTIVCDVAIGQTTLTNVQGSIQAIGLRSAVVEGPGIPAGTRLVSDANGALTINAAPTASTVQATVRLFPYGNGNGATTFNLPDSRGRTDFGRDDMGGQGAGRLVQTVDGGSLQAGAFDAGAGRERATLGLIHLPTSIPGGKVTVNYPSSNYTTYGALANIISAASGALQTEVWEHTGPASAPPQVGSADFTVDGSNANPTGGQPFGIIPPAHVTNKIIFAGV